MPSTRASPALPTKFLYVIHPYNDKTLYSLFHWCILFLFFPRLSQHINLVGSLISYIGSSSPLFQPLSLSPSLANTAMHLMVAGSLTQYSMLLPPGNCTPHPAVPPWTSLPQLDERSKDQNKLVLRTLATMVRSASRWDTRSRQDWTITTESAASVWPRLERLRDPRCIQRLRGPAHRHTYTHTHTNTHTPTHVHNTSAKVPVGLGIIMDKCLAW